MNLVIHYLKDDNAKDAFELIKDLSPSVPHEYILKGTVYATLGQEQHSVSICWNFILLTLEMGLGILFEYLKKLTLFSNTIEEG